MTTEKHDPWALLREARESVFRDSLCREYDDSHKAAAMEEHRRRTRLLDRIDAALAGRAEGSTEDVVEWQMTNSPIGTMHAYLDGVDLRVRWDGQDAAWDATRYGRCTTEAEARRAATAAARGMR